jgi:hypothetical protein
VTEDVPTVTRLVTPLKSKPSNHKKTVNMTQTIAVRCATRRALQTGGFVSLPAKMHHYAWTATPTVVQITLEGPFDISDVNPSDDPH